MATQVDQKMINMYIDRLENSAVQRELMLHSEWHGNTTKIHEINTKRAVIVFAKADGWLEVKSR